MGRTATNYDKTIIYKIVCKNPLITDCYIGHTTNLTNRKHVHKGDCSREKSKAYNYKLYQFIREHGDFENWDFIVIEQIKLKNSYEATARERYWIELLKPTLNSRASQFISYDGITSQNIICEDKKEENKLRTNMRQKKEREELISLRKEVIELKNIIEKLKANN